MPFVIFLIFLFVVISSNAKAARKKQREQSKREHDAMQSAMPPKPAAMPRQTDARTAAMRETAARIDAERRQHEKKRAAAKQTAAQPPKQPAKHGSMSEPLMREGECAPGHAHGEIAAILQTSAAKPAKLPRFSKNEAVNGLIWGEIMNGPRSGTARRSR